MTTQNRFDCVAVTDLETGRVAVADCDRPAIRLAGCLRPEMYVDLEGLYADHGRPAAELLGSYPGDSVWMMSQTFEWRRVRLDPVGVWSPKVTVR